MKKHINFEDNYPKLHKQDYALLLSVRVVPVIDLDKEFIEYDTKKSDGSYYQIPKKDDIILLCFVGDKNIPFTTRRKYTKQKHNHYKSMIGQWFRVVILE